MSLQRLSGLGREATGAVLIGVVLLASLAASYLLPLSLFASGLLVTLLALIASVAFVPGVWPTLYRTTGVSARAWGLAIGVAAGGIAVSYLLGSPQPFCEGSTHRGCLTAYGYASAVWLASSLGIAISAGHLGRYRRIRKSSLGPAADVDAGLVAVEGRITPAAGTRPGPVSGEPTVWYQAVVERPAAFGGYLQTDREVAGGEFYVADGSGRLLVSPDGIDAHDAAALARSHTSDDGEQRRREWSYQPDDAVTVVGRARDVSRAEYPEPVVVGADAPVIVGRGRRRDLLAWAARRALVGGAIAVVVGGLSLLGMLLAA